MSKRVPRSEHSPAPPAPTLPQPPAIRSRFAVSRGHTCPRVHSGSTRITPFSPGRPSAPGLCLRGPGSRPSWFPPCTHDTMFLKVPGNPPSSSGTAGPPTPSSLYPERLRVAAPVTCWLRAPPTGKGHCSTLTGTEARQRGHPSRLPGRQRSQKNIRAGGLCRCPVAWLTHGSHSLLWPSGVPYGQTSFRSAFQQLVDVGSQASEQGHTVAGPAVPPGAAALSASLALELAAGLVEPRQGQPPDPMAPLRHPASAPHPGSAVSVSSGFLSS